MTVKRGAPPARSSRAPAPTATSPSPRTARSTASTSAARSGRTRSSPSRGSKCIRSPSPRRDALPVVRQLHVGRQELVRLLVRQRVGDVREPRLLRADPLGRLHRLFDGEVRRVLLPLP